MPSERLLIHNTSRCIHTSTNIITEALYEKVSVHTLFPSRFSRSSMVDIMADSNERNDRDQEIEENDRDDGPISPNVVARLRASIANNPHQTTSVLVTALLTICPALLTGPLLSLLGFGGLGPAAGKCLQFLRV